MNALTLVIAIILVALVIFALVVVTIRSRNKAAQQAALNPESQQLYVGNLAYRIGDKELFAHFKHYGRIKEARVIVNSHTGRSKGFGFVTFSSPKEAEKALSTHGGELDGRTLVVRVAKPR